MHTLSLFYWIIIVLLWFVLGLYNDYSNGSKAYWPLILLFLLLSIIGVKYFPIPLH